MNGLCDSVYVKFIHCSSGKEIWEKPQNIYEGDAKVKPIKLQTYIGQFEELKMKEDENIAAYFLRVEETLNEIIGLGEEVDESIIIQKVLRSLSMRFDPKISTLEERENIDRISMDELHGNFTAYEMRIEHESLVIKEETFKASKKSKKKGQKKEKEDRIDSDILGYDEEVTNFVKRLKKGTNDRYRGKLPLICLWYWSFF
jgi:hypothetical protein